MAVVYQNKNQEGVAILTKFASSYGAMITVMGFMTFVESTQMQQLSLWWYHINVPRI